MPQFFTTVPGVVIAVGGIIAGAVVGVLYVIGLVKGKKDTSDDRLINILQDTVTALETKVDNQKKEHDEVLTKLTADIKSLTGKVDELEKENETLTKVLQGRDEQTQLFYKKAFEAMEVSNRTFAVVDTMNKTMAELMKALTEHFKTGITINNQPLA